MRLTAVVQDLRRPIPEHAGRGPVLGEATVARGNGPGTQDHNRYRSGLSQGHVM